MTFAYQLPDVAPVSCHGCGCARTCPEVCEACPRGGLKNYVEITRGHDNRHTPQCAGETLTLEASAPSDELQGK